MADLYKASVDAERNLHWDITLMKVIGEVIETAEGARLVDI